MLKEIINPLTDNYLNLKNKVLSSDFSWYWNNTTTYDVNENNENNANKFTNAPFYGHCVLERPSRGKNLYPKTNSVFIEECNKVISEIADFNFIHINCIFRINFNCSFYFDGNITHPHYDHEFPHKNLLIYLNECDGDTIVYGEKETLSFSPKKDASIIFEGKHCCGQPKPNERRVVLIATFI